MSPSLSLAILYAVIAGMINGSFALPTKHAKLWNFENIWLGFALWGFVITPWVVSLLADSRIIQIYQAAPTEILVLLITGGFLFGVGAVCFALALKSIGFGLGFLINIGLGTGLGFLVPLLVFHAEKIFTPFGVSTLVGLVFIVVGFLISYHAGHKRDRWVQGQTMEGSSKYRLSILFAMVAGIFSAGQNFIFAMTADMQQLALAAGFNSLAAAVLIWPVFLSCSFVPYAIYMLYLHKKNHSFSLYRAPGSLRNIGFVIVMGVFWYGSVALYSESSLLIGELGPIVAWPLFMVLIILASNFWGWRHNEWEGCPAGVQRQALLSIAALVVAVLILAYSATLSN